MSEENKLTAYHEAGHMVAAWELGLTVLGATIVPNAEAGYAGRVVVPIEDRVRYADWVESEYAYLYAHMVVGYAGAAAGERYSDTPMPEVNVDLVERVSPDEDIGGIAGVLLEISGPDEEEQLRTSDGALRHAEQLVASRWRATEMVAEVLVDRGTLDETECREILERSRA